jgi:hypothetical protein
VSAARPPAPGDTTSTPVLAALTARASLIQAETTWRLTPDAVEVWRGGRLRHNLRLTDVTAVRIGFDPIRLAPDRRALRIMTALHPMPAVAAMVIPSSHRIRSGHVASRLADWSLFTRALLPALKAAQPKVLIETGPVGWPYSAAASLGMGMLVLMALAGALAILGVPAPALLLGAVGGVAVLFPWLRRWLAHNRRRLVDPLAPPAELVPLPVPSTLTAAAGGGTSGP